MTTYFLLSFILFFGGSWSTHKLVKTKIATGVSMSLPKELSPVSSAVAAQRYPSARAPLATFTNVEETINFSVNISATQWPDARLDIAQQFFKSSIYNLYDQTDWISEGIREVNNKQYVYFEFNSTVRGDKRSDLMLRYVYVQYLIESDRTLVFTFSCNKSLQPDWQHTTHAMMSSIRVR